MEVTELLSDYRQNGAAALLKYEKKKRKPKSREEVFPIVTNYNDANVCL